MVYLLFEFLFFIFFASLYGSLVHAKSLYWYVQVD